MGLLYSECVHKEFYGGPQPISFTDTVLSCWNLIFWSLLDIYFQMNQLLTNLKGYSPSKWEHFLNDIFPTSNA